MNGNPESFDPQSTSRTNIFFRMTAVVAGLFAITVFAFMSTIFGDPRAPIHRFLSEYGGVLIAVEVAVALLCGLLALAVDRRAIVNDSANRPATTVEFEPATLVSATSETPPKVEPVVGGDDS